MWRGASRYWPSPTPKERGINCLLLYSACDQNNKLSHNNYDYDDCDLDAKMRLSCLEV